MTMTPTDDKRYRVRVVMNALEDAGVSVCRETVNRAAVTLGIQARDDRFFDRRWSDADIEVLIRAFRLRQQRLTWEEVVVAIEQQDRRTQVANQLDQLQHDLVELVDDVTDRLAALTERASALLHDVGALPEVRRALATTPTPPAEVGAELREAPAAPAAELRQAPTSPGAELREAPAAAGAESSGEEFAEAV